MKIKTNELIGRTLDYAVATCRGKGIEFECPHDPWLTVDGIADMPLHAYTPSTDWSLAGPTIEQERITVSVRHDGWWRAWLYDINDEPSTYVIGPTPLIAAMRCLVTSRLGEEVDVPDELVRI